MKSRVRVRDVEVMVSRALDAKELRALLKACASIAVALEPEPEPERQPIGFAIHTERADEPEADEAGQLRGADGGGERCEQR